MKHSAQGPYQSSHKYRGQMAAARCLLLTLLLSACSSTPKFQLQQDVLAAGLSPADVSVIMMPVSGQGATLSLAGDRPMQPASTMKLLTTAVALDSLGVNWRGESRLLVAKEDVARQTLSKPLILQGLSDTDLSYGELSFMLQQLYDQGIRHIPQGLQLDRSLFLPSRPAADAAPFDDAPRARYNHVPDPLMLQQNMHWLSLSAVAGKVQGWFSPAWPAVQLDVSALKPVAGPCADFSIHQQHIVLEQHEFEQHSTKPLRLKIGGEFPANCQWQGQLELLDRDVNVQLAVQSYWRQLGGTIGNQLLFHQAAADSQLVVQHVGRPLPEIVYRINKFSDNALARLVYANLAVVTTDMTTDVTTAITTLQSADQQVERWLSAHHISTSGMVVDNGSGLSRTAKISVQQLAAVLKASWSSTYSAEFVASLPLAGVDGTLKQRFRQGAAYQRARLKTGSLRDVTALAGYVWDRHNQPWIFVGFVNSAQATAKGRPLLERWVQQLAEQ